MTAQTETMIAEATAVAINATIVGITSATTATPITAVGIMARRRPLTKAAAATRPAIAAGAVATACRKLIVRRIDAVTQLPQRAQQRRLRTLMHPLHTAQAIHAVAKTNECAEKTCRSPRIADE